MKLFVVEHYEFKKYISGLDKFFKTYEEAKEYVSKQKKFEREEDLEGFSYKIKIEERN